MSDKDTAIILVGLGLAVIGLVVAAVSTILG